MLDHSLKALRRLSLKAKKLKRWRKNRRRKSVNLENSLWFDFSSLDARTLDQLNTKASRFWRQEGSSPENIYWSVITDGRFKSLKDGEIKEEFFKSGEHDFELIWTAVKKYSTPLSELDVLDYGAGVGRISRAFLPRVKSLTCADFSGLHLNECQKNLAHYSEKNFNIERLESWKDIEKLQKFDLIYSLITLQHNTPPIIEVTLRSLLKKLKDGGIALLHIPLTANNYKFDPQEY